MTQKSFSFDFSKAMFKFGAKSEWQNLTLSVNAIAHIHSSGIVHHVDIDFFTHEGCVFSANLIWLVNRDLFKEIEIAAISHAEVAFEDSTELEIEND